jgi:peptidyl-prolyl cis-trans isomerase SurA
VNQELVTAGEVQQRLAQVHAEAARSGAKLPPEPELRRQVVEALIEERVLVTYARDSGVKIDEAELDRAVANVAQQNRITMAQLRERLKSEGLDYTRFRNSVRDQLMVERTREREVQSRIKVSDAEIDAFLDKQRGHSPVELNIAQVLVTVPEGASVEEVVRRRALAEQAQARVKNGEPFEAVAKAMSEDGNKERGGEIGLKPADRLPDAFVAQVRAILAMDDSLRAELETIDVPTLVLVGSQDILTPMGDSEELAEEIPGAELVVIRGAAHGFMLEHGAAFNRTVVEFLDRVCGVPVAA